MVGVCVALLMLMWCCGDVGVVVVSVDGVLNMMVVMVVYVLC